MLLSQEISRLSEGTQQQIGTLSQDLNDSRRSQAHVVAAAGLGGFSGQALRGILLAIADRWPWLAMAGNGWQWMAIGWVLKF